MLLSFVVVAYDKIYFLSNLFFPSSDVYCSIISIFVAVYLILSQQCFSCFFFFFCNNLLFLRAWSTFVRFAAAALWFVYIERQCLLRQHTRCFEWKHASEIMSSRFCCCFLSCSRFMLIIVVVVAIATFSLSHILSSVCTWECSISFVQPFQNVLEISFSLKIFVCISVEYGWRHLKNCLFEYLLRHCGEKPKSVQ